MSHPAYSGPVTLFSPGISGDPAYSGPVTIRETPWTGAPAYSGPAPRIAYVITGSIVQTEILSGTVDRTPLVEGASVAVSGRATLAAVGEVVQLFALWPGVGVRPIHLYDRSARFRPAAADDFIGPGD